MEQLETLDLFMKVKSLSKGHYVALFFIMNKTFIPSLRIKVEETNENYEEKEAVVTGYFPKIHEHETYIFYGQFKDHPRFGMQFQVGSFSKRDAADESKGSSLIYRVKCLKESVKKQLKRIVETLGENAISKILK